MKRYGNIFNKIISLDNLRDAHYKARKGKSHYTEVKMVDCDMDYYLRQIQESLINKTYKTSEYIKFIKNDGIKEREIFKLPYYPDRIIQTAIMLQIEPVFLKNFIFDTYSALPNKGIHKASRRLTQFMKNKDEAQYCLKIDVKKFFPNVDKEILKSMLSKKFKDTDLLDLLSNIIDSCDKGLPIGNYTSQYFGNFYLSYFDHWIKEVKHIKMYIRYMDDCVILHKNKDYLHQLRIDIQEYFTDNLKLTLKENWQVFPTFVRGIDFVGYRHFKNYKIIRKRTKRNLKQLSKNLKKKLAGDALLSFNDKCKINSYIGWLSWANTYRLRDKYIKPLLINRGDD